MASAAPIFAPVPAPVKPEHTESQKLLLDLLSAWNSNFLKTSKLQNADPQQAHFARVLVNDLNRARVLREFQGFDLETVQKQLDNLDQGGLCLGHLEIIEMDGSVYLSVVYAKTVKGTMNQTFEVRLGSQSDMVWNYVLEHVGVEAFGEIDFQLSCNDLQLLPISCTHLEDRFEIHPEALSGSSAFRFSGKVIGRSVTHCQGLDDAERGPIEKEITMTFFPHVQAILTPSSGQRDLAAIAFRGGFVRWHGQYYCLSQTSPQELSHPGMEPDRLLDEGEKLRQYMEANANEFVVPFGSKETTEETTKGHSFLQVPKEMLPALDKKLREMEYVSEDLVSAVAKQRKIAAAKFPDLTFEELCYVTTEALHQLMTQLCYAVDFRDQFALEETTSDTPYCRIVLKTARSEERFLVGMPSQFDYATYAQQAPISPFNDVYLHHELEPKLWAVSLVIINGRGEKAELGARVMQMMFDFGVWSEHEEDFESIADLAQFLGIQNRCKGKRVYSEDQELYAPLQSLKYTVINNIAEPGYWRLPTAQERRWTEKAMQTLFIGPKGQEGMVVACVFPFSLREAHAKSFTCSMIEKRIKEWHKTSDWSTLYVWTFSRCYGVTPSSNLMKITLGGESRFCSSPHGCFSRGGVFSSPITGEEIEIVVPHLPLKHLFVSPEQAKEEMIDLIDHVDVETSDDKDQEKEEQEEGSVGAAAAECFM